MDTPSRPKLTASWGEDGLHDAHGDNQILLGFIESESLLWESSMTSIFPPSRVLSCSLLANYLWCGYVLHDHDHDQTPSPLISERMWQPALVLKVDEGWKLEMTCSPPLGDSSPWMICPMRNVKRWTTRSVNSKFDLLELRLAWAWRKPLRYLRTASVGINVSTYR